MFLRSTVFFLLLVSSLCTHAQWSSLNNFPGGDRLGSMSFELNGAAHLLGGTRLVNGSYEAFDDCWKYDPNTDEWKACGYYPGGNIYGGFSFVVDGKVYIGMGADETGSLNTEVWAFDGSAWIRVSDFPVQKRLYPMSFAAGGKGYIGAGFSGGYFNDFWEYDPVTDQWSNKTAYPGGGRVGMATFSINNQLYAGLGDNGNSFFNDFYLYDPSTDSWSALDNFVGQNRSFASCISTGSNGYMIGGEDDNGGFSYTAQFWKYEPLSDAWQVMDSFDGAPRRYAGFYLIDSLFYYGMGQTGANDDDLTDDFWSYEPPLPNGLSIAETKEGTSVYPNPFWDKLIIESTSKSPASMEVYDLQMQLIYEGPVTTLSTIDWTPQVYFARVMTANKTQIFRILKAQ